MRNACIRSLRRAAHYRRGLLLLAVLLLGLSPLLPRAEGLGSVHAQAATPESMQAQGLAEEEDPPEAAVPDLVSAICPGRFTVSAAGIPLKLAYCTDPGRSLDLRDETITRAIVVIHGSSRNAADYHAYARDSALAVGAAGSTIVVAPQYLEEGDIDAFKTSSRPLADLLFWNGGWREGGDSLDTAANDRGATISSFAAADQIIGRLADRTYFPNLRTVVVAGHSAGGQFTNRFAAASRAEPVGITRRYVAMNPSSWLYFTRERRVGATQDQFAVPSATEQHACPTFDHYKYGLANLGGFPYVAAVGAEQLMAQYASRTVTYLLGERDNADTNSLDTDCEAKLQGDFRLDRGNRYHTYVGRVFGASVYSRHVKEIVPGVGHSGNGMINSAGGRRYLFDHGLPPAPVVSCSPRPPVDVATTVGDGALQVTLGATGDGNAIRTVRVGVGDRPSSNAIVDIAGGPSGLRDEAVYAPSVPVTQLRFTIHRATPGQPTIVPIGVTDGCGRWETIVGGGVGAGF